MIAMIFRHANAVTAVILLVAGIAQHAAAQETDPDARVLNSPNETASGHVNPSNGDLKFADVTAKIPVPTAGIRLLGDDVPRGSEIPNTYVNIRVDEINSDLVRLESRGAAEASPIMISNKIGDIASHSPATAFASWSPVPATIAGAAGADKRTHAVTAIIQEIPDWAPGNALVIIASALIGMVSVGRMRIRRTTAID